MSAASRRASSASASTELARQRDLTKYYQPWLDSKKLNAVPVNTGPDADRPVRCSHDTALTAFAQLAALRLNVKRGMVSLIDTQTQIILAEATQTLSLADERRHAPGDHIWLGNVTLPRGDCMDEHTLGAITISKDNEGRDVEVPALVVNDTLEDDRFKTRPYVTSGSAVRFYAGVPIVTKHGYSIGAYAVSDPRPRPEGLTYDQLQFMGDVAQTIAEHLERVMSSMGRVSERDFMRGISYFLEDLSEYKYKINNADRSVQPPDSTQASDKGTSDSQSMLPRGRQSQPRSTDISAASSVSPKRSSIPDTVEVPQYSRDNDSNPQETPDPSKDNIRRIFVQASQLLCEQAKATGCLFVDASSGLFSGQSEGGISPLGTVDPWATADVALESNEDEEPYTNDTKRDLMTYSGKTEIFSEGIIGDRLDEMAEVISIALAEGCADEFRHGVIKRKSLKKCIMRYPFGKCFYLNKGRVVADNSLALDEAITGGGPTQTSSNKLSQHLQDQSPLKLPREVLEHIPDAKWLIFLPLFNYSQGQWYAAGFIWGNDFKMGDPDDALPYFKTFGSCMMSEVASMEVLNTNIAKSTFIASISHDLRSPLHGMLGNLEFLQDTITSAYQMSLTGAMETCGKTLLDTIDHLLDYAKINNNLKWTSSSRGKRLQKATSANEPSSLTTSFDLAVLLEEVVEAVFAGQTFRKADIRYRDPAEETSAHMKSMNLDNDAPLDEQIHHGSAKFSGKVFLILDIQKTSWHVQGQTGALRRVIMNVVGNAIKYCKAGCIEISLRASRITSSGIDVQFAVRDTGIGMSKDFLENHLFKAFSQEDSFTPGTGLGLSITSQIVSNLHGKIRVDSEKGVGTHVNITIPMTVAPPTAFHDDQQDIRDAIEVTTGKKLCILDPMVDEKLLGKEQFSKLESSITALFRDWFGMDVIQSPSVDTDSDTAIFVYAEPPPIEKLVERHFDRKEKGRLGKKAALLIICTNAFEAAALRAAGIEKLASLGRIVEVISQPVGVRKLAKVLLQCLRRIEAEIPKENTSASSRSPSPLPSREIQKRAAEIEWNASPVVYDESATHHRPSINSLKWKSDELEAKLHTDENAHAPSPSPSTPSDSTVSQHIQIQSDHETRQQPRVLLVDDNAINLKLLVTFMKKINLPYAEAMNGLEAVNKFKNADQPFDVVLMDLQMPVMDGVEATRKIREYEQSDMMKPAHIIAITGVGNDAARQEAMDAGMSEFLTKPVRFKVLQQLLLET
ncbi:hypothetical protein F5Y19DRAFT_444299 [Xylariaceae sp. FL1651]|nr:hypothetical protein F5Y19DRAFT_444299 [Xylariaceae sp. FL1651]